MRDRRISIDRCRRLIGSTCGLGDSEISVVRDQLYVLAEVIVDQLDKRSSSVRSNQSAAASNHAGKPLN